MKRIKCKHGFEQLYKENYARLYYYAFQFTNNAETCKDIVNDVFEKTWNQFETLQQETIVAYLYTNTRHKCIDPLRHCQVEEQYADFYRTVTHEETDNSSSELQVRLAGEHLLDRRMSLYDGRINNIYFWQDEDQDQRHVSLSIVYRFNNYSKKYKGKSAADDVLNRL